MNEKIPPELFEKLMDARLEWSRHGYQLAARAMIHIDEALDEMNEHLRQEEFDNVFGTYTA